MKALRFLFITSGLSAGIWIPQLIDLVPHELTMSIGLMAVATWLLIRVSSRRGSRGISRGVGSVGAHRRRVLRTGAGSEEVALTECHLSASNQ